VNCNPTVLVLKLYCTLVLIN